MITINKLRLFQEYISDMKNCTLESNFGYTDISLEIYGVQDAKKDDEYMNLIIYLSYHPEYARPSTIRIDTTDENKLNDEIKQTLKKEFRTLDLRSAFDKILADNSAFIWKPMDGTESPLELNVRHLICNL